MILSRRSALRAAGLSAVCVAAGCMAVPSTSGRRLRPAVIGDVLREPPVLASGADVLDVELVAAPGVELAGTATSALGYNGSSPGPTLRVRPGDRLKVRVVNRLTAPTNLHTHGLRVSPTGNGDNAFLAVEPGQAFQYVIDVPADHPAGTFWYHPHHHGTAAEQVFGGLVGALVVEPATGDRSDSGLGVVHDRVLVVTDTTLLADGSVAVPSAMDRMAGRHGSLVLVNGQLRPVIEAQPGGAQRWRVVNGCASRVLPLRLIRHRLTQVALDGTFLAAPTELDRVVLAPGNRADLVVRPDTTGRFTFVADAYGAGGAETLAVLAVDGPARPLPDLPRSLTAEPPPGGPVAVRRRVRLGGSGMGMGGMGGMAFTIDGRSFDPDRDDQTVRLGDVEEWDVVNVSMLDHPFHLHTWPFTVVAGSGGVGAAAGTAQDVVLVPAGGWVRLRIAFVRYAGRSVYHCHVLDHEDAGMMATVAVVA